MIMSASPWKQVSYSVHLKRIWQRRGIDLSISEAAKSETAEAEMADTEQMAPTSLYFDLNRFMAFCEGNPSYRTTFIGLIKNMINKGENQISAGRDVWRRTD